MKKVEREDIPRIQFFDLLPNSFILLKLFNIRKFEAIIRIQDYQQWVNTTENI